MFCNQSNCKQTPIEAESPQQGWLTSGGRQAACGNLLDSRFVTESAGLLLSPLERLSLSFFEYCDNQQIHTIV